MPGDEWRTAHTRMYAVRYLNSTGIPDAISRWMHDHGTTNNADFLKAAIEEKLSAEGYLQSDNIMFKLRKSADEYGMTIIEWVASALDERRAFEEAHPEMGHLNPVQAIQEMYQLSHPDGI